MAKKKKVSGLGGALFKFDTSNIPSFLGEQSSDVNSYGLLNQFSGNNSKLTTGNPAMFGAGDLKAIDYNARNNISASQTNSNNLADDGFIDLGSKSVAEKYADVGKPMSYLNQPMMPTRSDTTSYDDMLASGGKYSNGSVAKDSALGNATNSYLPSGWFDGRKNGDIYNTKDDGSGEWMKSGNFSDSKLALTDLSSTADATKYGFTTNSTDAQMAQAHKDQGYLDNNTFQTNLGMGLGALQLGASLYSTFADGGSMDMNKKNIELMDGQIANNNDIMATRKARAADIKKYFG